MLLVHAAPIVAVSPVPTCLARERARAGDMTTRSTQFPGMLLVHAAPIVVASPVATSHARARPPSSANL